MFGAGPVYLERTFNGGGDANNYSNTNYTQGGGSTDFRLLNGE
jgi:hypothetical protein